MTRLFTTLCACLLTTHAFAQWTNIGPGGESLSAISFFDAANGWACGANSILYRTQDGGKTWTSIPNFYNFKPHNNMLSIVATTSDLMVLIEQLPSTASPAIIYHGIRDKAGLYEYLSGPDGVGDYNKLNLRQLATGFAVGNGGALALTHDRGFTWTTASSGTSNDLFAADSPDETVTYLAGSKGTLRKAAGPNFTNWQALNTTTTARLTGVWFVTPKQGYLVGDAGTALRTTDGGLTWTAMPVNTAADLAAVRFLTATTGFIVGDLGTLLLTTDGGKSWQPEASHTYETLTDISATADGSTTWVSGGGGTVLQRGAVVLAGRSPAAGKSWAAYPTRFTEALNVSLPGEQAARLKLLDLTGRTLTEQLLPAGKRAETWPLRVPEQLSAGVYVVEVTFENQAPQTQRVVHLQ
ncbi:YCF48-related protein [Hymenobacter sp. BRD67]|uniref:YCF48-related protein n=1 Tax=Hymenobacter sp. BRD67 TaxID=2675877 RepID=UPI001563175C|nr:YCF48-related protein [Hymenobacter sp. BRD67]QKG51966.1 hypothetical protein GKZ67_04250 [Hymenobacter sp. BRD67]